MCDVQLAPKKMLTFTLRDAQVAPKEVLTTRNGLSAPTLRLLAQPPVPLQLSYVDAATEFPEAMSSLQTLSKQVLLPPSMLGKRCDLSLLHCANHLCSFMSM